MSAVTVIGVDGRPLAPWAAQRLAAARLVVGARRHLDALPVPPEARRHAWGDVEAGIAEVRAHAGPAVVLASGDPGFFGVARLLRERGLEAEVAPAVSSVAAAFAAAGLSWDDALVVSAHGRDPRRAANACRALPKVAVLTGPGSGPAELGGALAGWGRRLVVAEDLGGPDQRVVACTPEEAAAATWTKPCVVLSLADDPAAGTGRDGAGPGWAWPPRVAPTGWALPDAAYDHRDGMVTKAEVRALVLARLGPGPGDLVWDLGCGSGSVAVECARFGAAVVAVDRDPAQCSRARANAAGHGVCVRVEQGDAAALAAGLPRPDAVFVGGGGAAALSAAVAAAARVVVVALAAVDRVATTRDALAAAGYAVEGVQLGAARLSGLADGASRLAAANPVFVLWGQR